MNDEFIKMMVRRVVEVAVSGQALRNQGAPGVVDAAKDHLLEIDLREWAQLDAGSFGPRLDAETAALVEKLPADARSWGAARKAINLVLRDAVYSADLCDHFSLRPLRPVLELPLDKHVGAGIAEDAVKFNLSVPAWKQIKTLAPSTSATYQDAASTIATRRGIHRVDLDLYYWRASGTKAKRS